MATMLRCSYLFLSFISAILTFFNVDGQRLYLQSYPTYLQSRLNTGLQLDWLKMTEIPDFISAVAGFTPSEHYTFKSLKAGNPFDAAKCVVVVEFSGYRDSSHNKLRPFYQLDMDAPPGWTYQITADRIYARFPNKELNLIEIVNDDSLYAVKAQYPQVLDTVAVRPSDLENNLLTSNKSVLHNKPLQSLNVTNTPDLAFLLDVQLINEVIEALPSKKDILRFRDTVDLFWFRFTSFQDLMSVYGPQSPQVTEAVTIIDKVLQQVEKVFSGIYGYDILILYMHVDYQASLVTNRVRRSLSSLSTSTVSANVSHNIAEDYNEDYPAIFNIILLTMLIITLSVFAIALGTWNMDPGRDSIIYRMTSQRIKKDQ